MDNDVIYSTRHLQSGDLLWSLGFPFLKVILHAIHVSNKQMSAPTSLPQQEKTTHRHRIKEQSALQENQQPLPSYGC